MKRMEDRNVIVTGGAQGIGLCAVETFLREGARVLIADLDGKLASSEAARLQSEYPDRVLAVTADISRRSDVVEAVTKCVEEFGGLDVMVAHAGIADVEPFFETSEASWRKMLNVNMDGAFFSIQEAARVMAAGGGGSIVVTASTNASWVESNAAAYNASKGGVVALVRSAALDLAPYGVRVNAVNPGLIRTRLTRYVTEIPEHAADYLTRIPLDRFGEVSDIANAMLFLASDESSWITGVDLMVDGGQTLGTPLPLPEDPFPLSARADEQEG